MFSQIWQRLKELIQGMINPKSVEQVLHVVPAVSNEMLDAIELWELMYEDKSPWLVEPSPGNPAQVLSLGLPAFISSEKARMAVMEMKFDITPVTKTVDELEEEQSQNKNKQFNNNQNKQQENQNPLENMMDENLLVQATCLADMVDDDGRKHRLANHLPFLQPFDDVRHDFALRLQKRHRMETLADVEIFVKCRNAKQFQRPFVQTVSFLECLSAQFRPIGLLDFQRHAEHPCKRRVMAADQNAVFRLADVRFDPPIAKTPCRRERRQ